MHVGSVVTVKYRGEMLTREIIKIAFFDEGYSIFWIEGVTESFTKKDVIE
jgi:hypothetical protein